MDDFGSLLNLVADRVESQIFPAERDWRDLARPKQLPPDDPRHHEPDANGFRCGCTETDERYNIFLFCAGRGTGKTAAGANWVIDQALKHYGSYGVVAPTFNDVKFTCFEGPSGIRRALHDNEVVSYNKSDLIIKLRNGSEIRGFSGDQPERLRGPNLSGAWVDELGSFRYEASWYEGLMPALRIGEHPRVFVTTTPRPTKLIRDLVSRKDGSVHITTGSTWENRDNLSASALAELKHRYEGTRLGRQELEGELLTDIEGAMWSRAQIDADRVTTAPEDRVRVVVAIDPAVTSGEDSDESGIVVAAECTNGHGYILEDLSLRGSPDEVISTAVAAFYRWQADQIVAEANNGGDFIGALVKSQDARVPYLKVTASRGKQVRAQPVANLYAQHLIHHVGTFADLEDQLVTWLPDDPKSPDRLDALVWACTALKGLFGSRYTAFHAVCCEECGGYTPLEYGRCQHCGEEFPPGTLAA